MTVETETKIAFCSSLQHDVWHDVRGPGAFEGWHFDAISDDGQDVLILDLYDNYVLSPRFYEGAQNPETQIRRSPAASLIYYSRRQIYMGAINEFEADAVSVTDKRLAIGKTSFLKKSVAYGTTLSVNIELASFGGRTIRGEIEWLLIESDLVPLDDDSHDAVWNLVAPRADVTGRLDLIGHLGKKRRSIEIRGTGSHDHILSRDVHYKDLRSRMWGRTHFADATLVYERHGGVRDPTAPGRFFVIANGKIREYTADCHATEHKRNMFGVNIPRRIAYLAGDGTRVRVKPFAVIRSDFCEVKMLSSTVLTFADGTTREAVGITEFVDPSRMQSAFVRRASDLRIGKNGRAGLF